MCHPGAQPTEREDMRICTCMCADVVSEVLAIVKHPIKTVAGAL